MFNNNNCDLSIIMGCYVKVDGYMDYMSSIMTYAMCIMDKLIDHSSKSSGFIVIGLINLSYNYWTGHYFVILKLIFK